jgi:hypothetical protein
VACERVAQTLQCVNARTKKKPLILRTGGCGEVLRKPRAGFGEEEQDYDQYSVRSQRRDCLQGRLTEFSVARIIRP